MAMCSTRVSCRLTAVLLGLALVAHVSGVRAQTHRDPTMPPAGATSAALPTAAESRNPVLEAGPVAVIVREGRPYLVVGTRLYAQGQMLGGARIERIGETEVWLREGKTLRRKPVFAGVERRVSGAPAALPKCALPARQKPSVRVPQSEICQP